MTTHTTTPQSTRPLRNKANTMDSNTGRGATSRGSPRMTKIKTHSWHMIHTIRKIDHGPNPGEAPTPTSTSPSLSNNLSKESKSKQCILNSKCVMHARRLKNRYALHVGEKRPYLTALKDRKSSVAAAMVRDTRTSAKYVMATLSSPKM